MHRGILGKGDGEGRGAVAPSVALLLFRRSAVHELVADLLQVHKRGLQFFGCDVVSPDQEQDFAHQLGPSVSGRDKKMVHCFGTNLAAPHRAVDLLERADSGWVADDGLHVGGGDHVVGAVGPNAKHDLIGENSKYAMNHCKELGRRTSLACLDERVARPAELECVSELSLAHVVLFPKTSQAIANLKKPTRLP